MAPKILEQPPDRPQIPSRSPEVSRGQGDAGSDLGVEAYAEPVVEGNPIHLRCIHDADLASDENLQRPPQIRAHAEGLDIVVTASGRQDTHDPSRPDTRLRDLVHGPIPPHSHDGHPPRQSTHDAPSVAGTLSDVPDRSYPSPLQKPRDMLPQDSGPPLSGRRVEHQMSLSSTQIHSPKIPEP